MTEKITSVTGDPGSAVTQVTGAGASVPEGTTQQGAGDANVDAGELLARLDKLEEDRRRQQAVYDRKLADEQKRNAALAAQLEEVQKSGMSEAERKAFEANNYKAKYEQLLAEQAAAKQMEEYTQAFVETFGIAPSELDRSSPDNLVTSGWEAAAKRIKALEEQAKGTPQTTVATQQAHPQAKITGSPGSQRTKATRSELMTQIAHAQGKQNITMDEFYRYVERNPELMNQWLSEE